MRMPGLIARLINASDQAQKAEISSGLLHILNAQTCDLLERPLRAVKVQNGSVSLEIQPRRIESVHLLVE
jgi:hypothetical protein